MYKKFVIFLISVFLVSFSAYAGSDGELKLSGKELLNQSRNDINSQLMTVVLKDSFLQNKKIKEISNQISKYIPPQINEQFSKKL